MDAAIRALGDRRAFSRNRLQGMSRRLRCTREFRDLPELCVYATGSYARYEASPHSDIDLFFVHPGSFATSPVPRLSELRLFARVINVGRKMEFPTFSNDGEYLRVLFLDDILNKLGSPEDDSQNFFTARMLLLLESAAVVNASTLSSIVDQIVEAYFRDYPDHPTNFRPVFLINDILRFWKTLCLNYEHRRNRPANDPGRKLRQNVKNFKLKFSRLMTCFGTVVAVCALPAPISKEQVTSLTRRTPFERFLRSTKGVLEVAELRSSITEDYLWFLQHTVLTTENLEALFQDPAKKAEMFHRADTFGERVHDVLDYFADVNHYRRYLVI
jgi:hypothetical protein